MIILVVSLLILLHNILHLADMACCVLLLETPLAIFPSIATTLLARYTYLTVLLCYIHSPYAGLLS